MDIQLIDTGFFHADGGAMFGAIPKTAWSRRYPSDKQNGCILAMRSMLVRDGNGKIVLVDNGAGNKHLKQLSYYNFFDLVDLKEELRRRDVACEDVTDVILTHLHFDHCGYTTQKEEQPGGKSLFKMAFPNAIHWVSRAQWENFLHPNALEADSYFIENMQAVYDSGKLRLIENDTNLCPGIDLRLFDGHTPGQIAPYTRHLSALMSSPAMSSRWRQASRPSGSRHTTPILSFPTTKKCGCWKKPPQRNRRSSTVTTPILSVLP